MIVSKILPSINEVHLMKEYSLLHILEGSGGVQIDFNTYLDWDDKLIFLEKGQYIKFLSEGFIVRKIEFEDQLIFQNEDSRVLFKHLVSIGYINFKECEDCQQFLNHAIFAKEPKDILDVSSEQWYWQNPFGANKPEYHLIFEVKDVIDQEFQNHLSNQDIVEIFQGKGYDVQGLIKDKVGLTVKNLLGNKRLLESKREIAFTDKSVQEIAYDLGFKDPAYFNRVFKKETGKSPVEFRNNFDFAQRDVFMQNLTELLMNFHQKQHEIAFYADKMNISIKTLSRKVKEKMNLSLGQLIRFELIQTSKKYLSQGVSVQEISFQLGFSEPNHFSSFFKKYVGISPSEFKK